VPKAPSCPPDFNLNVLSILTVKDEMKLKFRIRNILNDLRAKLRKQKLLSLLLSFKYSSRLDTFD
jgi:type II secretory ATPase GspE/PulE/Tfp pilus assembly ATPase PilB-like protein